jgi:D-alanyl-D-alanine carboxypeptidase
MTPEISKKEKFFAVFTVILLFIFAAGILGYISLNNKKQNDELREKVQALQNPEFIFSNLSFISYATSTMWAKRDSHATFVFKEKLFVLGGLDASGTIENGEPNYDKAKYYNDVWYTADGLNWKMGLEHTAFPPIRSTSIFEIGGKLFMVGGYSPDSQVNYNNGLWTSTDGINWKKENINLPWPKREGQDVVKFKNKILLIGGVNYSTKERFNDVWSTTDGYHWTLLAKNTAWEPRWDMEISEFNNKLWLTGGMTSVAKIFGDEWVTEDGINWRQVYQDAPFGKRQGHGAIASNGNLILIGGIRDTNDTDGEIWATTDGVNWQGIKTKWVSREDHGVTLFKNKIWVLGGMDSKYNWLGEILYSNFKTFDGNRINSETKNINLYPGQCATSSDMTTSSELNIKFVDQNNPLPQGFIPSNLVNISDLVKTDGKICLNYEAGINLIKMFKAAEKEGVSLGVTYGYRSPEEQQRLFAFWVKQEGETEALKGVAKPYYSEHGLGLAVDLTSKSINYLGISKKFAGTTESDWLLNNAHKYGFLLSYPEDKSEITKYIYEPWHYRYVGVDLASDLHSKNITFTEYQMLKK